MRRCRSCGIYAVSTIAVAISFINSIRGRSSTRSVASGLRWSPSAISAFFVFWFIIDRIVFVVVVCVVPFG